MSSKRGILLKTGEYYHIYNRSIGKENIFTNDLYLDRAINTIDYYRFPTTLSFSLLKKLESDLRNSFLKNLKKQQSLVEIYTFSLMPNHFHFELKQLQDNGIQEFIANFQNSFAKYFNIKENRVGGLFQDRFKAKRIETTEEFIHISRYIHLNHVTSSLISFEELKLYPYSSYMLYLNQNKNRFINIDIILNHFKTLKNYIKFVENQVAYQKKLKSIKRLLIDG